MSLSIRSLQLRAPLKPIGTQTWNTRVVEDNGCMSWTQQTESAEHCVVYCRCPTRYVDYVS